MPLVHHSVDAQYETNVFELSYRLGRFQWTVTDTTGRVEARSGRASTLPWARHDAGDALRKMRARSRALAPPPPCSYCGSADRCKHDDQADAA